jgi:hypothetical protein
VLLFLGNIFEAVLGTAKEPTIFREALPSIGKGVLSLISERGSQKGQSRLTEEERLFKAEQAELDRQHAMQLLLAKLGQDSGASQRDALLTALLGSGQQQQKGAALSGGILQRIADQVRESIIR